MKSVFLLVLLLILVTSCKNKTKNESISEEKKEMVSTPKLTQLQWLLGEWGNENGEEIMKELWKKENDSTFTGFAYTKVAQDTVFAETLKIQHLDEAILLTVVAYNQNDDVPVTFRMITLEDGKIVFENKAHDFPQRIAYTNPQQDSIHAWIEGTVKGELQKIDFYYGRK